MRAQPFLERVGSLMLLVSNGFLIDMANLDEEAISSTLKPVSRVRLRT